MKKSLILMVVFILLSAQVVWAHHPWIEKEEDRLEVKWGHPPKAEPYEPGKVKEIKVFDKTGKAVKFERKDEKDTVFLSSKSGISMASIYFEGGYIVKTPDGYKKVTKQEAQKSGLQIVDSFYYYQFAKSLFAYNKSVTKPVGMKFEIVPLKNPFALESDQLLPIKVLFEGRPIENIAVKVGKEEVAKTDKNGIAKIQVKEKGMQVIVMTYRIPTKNNPDADSLSYTTVLTWDRK